jgi:hypothetical protein
MDTSTIEPAVSKMTRDEARILAHYAAGETSRQIATSTGLSPDEIGLALDALAGNDRDRAQRLAMQWQARAKAVAAARGVSAPPAPRPIPAPATAEPEPPKAPKVEAVDTIADLIGRAIATDIPRFVRLADKVQDLLDQLDEQLAEHEKGKKLRAEAEQLEQRLAQIKRELSPKRATPAPAVPAPAVDSKAIRAWAAANGVDCPDRGRIPSSVLAAFSEQAVADLIPTDQDGRS